MLTVFSSGTISIVKKEWARCNQTEFYKMLARLMPREIHADVNAGTSLVELLQEIDEREAKHEEC